MQGRGRGREVFRCYNRGFGSNDGVLGNFVGPRPSMGLVREWNQCYAPSAVPASRAVGPWPFAGRPESVEMPHKLQSLDGRVVPGGARSASTTRFGYQRRVMTKEPSRPIPMAVGGGHGSGSGTLGKVGPGAAVYPDRRRRAGGRYATVDLREATGTEGISRGRGVVCDGLIRAGGRPCRGETGRGLLSSVGHGESTVTMGGGGGRCAEGDKQVCQFFLRTGTCAFGNRCKFFHPKDHRPPQLNPRGYPVRPDEKSCAFYVKHGWCAFGATCKFNHPFSLSEVNPKTTTQGPSLQIQQITTQPQPIQPSTQAMVPMKGQQVPAVYNPIAAQVSHPVQELPIAAPGFMSGSWPSMPNLWYPAGGLPGEGSAMQLPTASSSLGEIACGLGTEYCKHSEVERALTSEPMPCGKVLAVNTVVQREVSEESGRSSRTSFDGCLSPHSGVVLQLHPAQHNKNGQGSGVC